MASTLSSHEKQQAREYLLNSEAALRAAAAGLTEAQVNFKVAPDKWSIAGILEHCAAVHNVVLGRLHALNDAPIGPNPDAAAIDELFLKRGADRSLKANAPEMIHPQGGMSPTDALARVHDVNQILVERLETATNLRDRCIPGMPAQFLSEGKYQVMDGYQWILAVAGHLARHADQIAEIKASPSFPAA